MGSKHPDIPRSVCVGFSGAPSGNLLADFISAISSPPKMGSRLKGKYLPSSSLYPRRPRRVCRLNLVKYADHYHYSSFYFAQKHNFFWSVGCSLAGWHLAPLFGGLSVTLFFTTLAQRIFDGGGRNILQSEGQWSDVFLGYFYFYFFSLTADAVVWCMFNNVSKYV